MSRPSPSRFCHAGVRACAAPGALVLAFALAATARPAAGQGTTGQQATGQTVAALPTHAQRLSGPVPAFTAPGLSLDDAVALARNNNPSFQQSVNQRRVADAQLRAAKGGLLPQLSSNAGASYREGGQQLVQGQAFGATSSLISSSVGLDVTATYSVASLTAPRLQRASRDAVDADIGGAAQQLRTQVTQQYLTALQQQAQADLQDTLVATARAQLDLAKARVAVGAATVLDVRRAEVALGQQQVAAITARNQAEVEKLRLFQQIGVAPTDSVRLTTHFDVTDPGLRLEDLLAQARAANPTLTALRAREQVAALGVRQARGTYLPTLNFDFNVSGYASQYTNTNALVAQQLQAVIGQCQNTAYIRSVSTGQPLDTSACNGLTLTPAQIAQARALNGNVFSLTRAPYTFSAILSFPFFNGFSRELQVQQAVANRYDADYRTRAQELQTTADVTANYRTLEAQRQVVEQQARTVATAKEALTLAQERYRVGMGSFLDVSQARDDYARAQTDYITAVYQYHRTFAALEGAVGRPLR